MKRLILAAAAGLITGVVGTAAGVGALGTEANFMVMDNMKIFRTLEPAGWGLEVCGALYRNKISADGGVPLQAGCKSGPAIQTELVQNWVTAGEQFWRSR